MKGDGLPRVCIVNLSLPPVYGGAEIAAYRYAERYHRAGGQVVLVGPENEGLNRDDIPTWVKPIPRWRDDSPRALTEGMPGTGALWKATHVWPTIWGLRHTFDVLHIFNSASLFNLGAVPPARFCHKPVVLEMSLRGSDDPLTLKRWSRSSRIPLVRWPPLRYSLFRMANRFVAKSEALRKAFLQAGLAEARLVRIPYGVDVRQYRPVPDAKKRQLRTRLGLDESKVLILFVGSLNPRKGVHWLIEAFARLPGECSAHLVLVGPSDKFSDYAAVLRRAVSASNLDSRVTFVTSKATNVNEFMQACDVFTLASVREGLPISILEAMSSGLAVVASDIPEIADSQIQHGLEGILFPTGDVSALAAALERLVEDVGERQRLGSAARQRVEREFCTELVDGQYRRLYAELGQWNRANAGQ